MKIGLVQYNPDWEDKKSNQRKILNLLDSFNEKVSLLIFPELTLTGFTMKSEKFAEPLEEDTYNFFKDISLKHKTHIMAGMIENEKGNYFNTLLHIDKDGKLVCKYQKIHPFSFGGENRYYKSGNKPMITQIQEFRIGLTICYDLRFPELYRFYGKDRVDVILNIANWPEQRIDHWYSLLKVRAIENQCFTIGVNRVGKGIGNRYTGCSSVFHPFGEEMVSVQDEEKIITAKILKSEIDKTRQKYPFLEDITLK